MDGRRPIASKHPIALGLTWSGLTAIFVLVFARLQYPGFAILIAEQPLPKLLGVLGVFALGGIAFGYAMKLYVDKVVPRIPRGPVGWAITLPPSALILYLLFR